MFSHIISNQKLPILSLTSRKSILCFGLFSSRLVRLERQSRRQNLSFLLATLEVLRLCILYRCFPLLFRLLCREYKRRLLSAQSNRDRKVFPCSRRDCSMRLRNTHFLHRHFCTTKKYSCFLTTKETQQTIFRSLLQTFLFQSKTAPLQISLPEATRIDP